jgi:phosphoglycolate phosphatase
VGQEFCALEDLVILKTTAWIFDLDGTLVDSGKQIGDSINCARREFGFQPLPTSKIEELVGLPITHFLRDIEVNETDEQELILRFRQILEIEILRDNQVFPGVSDFLSQLKCAGLKTGIATSKPTYLAELVVKNSSLHGLLDVVQGTEGFPAKPDPTCIQKAMAKLKADNAIMVGDRIEDIQAAIAAGIDSIGIAHSFHDKATLEEAGAGHVFDTFLEFAQSKESLRLLVD